MEISRALGIGCVIRAEYAAGPLGLGLCNCWVTSRPGESRCCREVTQVLVILPGEHKARAPAGTGERLRCCTTAVGGPDSRKRGVFNLSYLISSPN